VIIIGANLINIPSQNESYNRGLRIGPIQRMGAVPRVIHTGLFFVLILLQVVGKINEGER
jgi:hypothetical protein